MFDGSYGSLFCSDAKVNVRQQREMAKVGKWEKRIREEEEGEVERERGQ